MTTQKKAEEPKAQADKPQTTNHQDDTPAAERQGAQGAQVRFDGGHDERRTDGLTQEQVTGRAPTGEVSGPIPPLAGEAAKDAEDGRPSVD